MQLSIICPTYNEINFIGRLIENLCTDDGIRKEILIVDGGSSDGTREYVQSKLPDFHNLRFVDNPKKTSTHGFNIAFKQSTGKYVAFVGAHAEYDPGYFKAGLRYLENNECDVVGGPLKQKGKNPTGRAIALAMSSKLGVGNTEFRTETKKMYVDSVAFAIYRRDMIEKCGLMDEGLPVNQDDEFHYRLKSKGYRILMVPEMSSVYYVRDSYEKLFHQYFRYGLYKPAVLKKVRHSIRLRHLVPAFFTIYILLLPIWLIFPFYIILLIAYIVMILIRSISFDDTIEVKLLSLPVFPILHFAYGSGFIMGLIRR